MAVKSKSKIVAKTRGAAAVVLEAAKARVGQLKKAIKSAKKELREVRQELKAAKKEAKKRLKAARAEAENGWPVCRQQPGASGLPWRRRPPRNLRRSPWLPNRR